MKGKGNKGVGERRPIEEGIKNGREKIMTHTLLHAYKYFNILVSLLSYLEDHKLVLSDQRFVHDVVFLCSNNNNNKNNDNNNNNQ